MCPGTFKQFVSQPLPGGGGNQKENPMFLQNSLLKLNSEELAVSSSIVLTKPNIVPLTDCMDQTCSILEIN